MARDTSGANATSPRRQVNNMGEITMEPNALREEAQAQIRRYNSEAAAWVSPYENWKKSQGLPTLRGFQVDNVYDVELTPWAARGGSGVFINLDGTGGFNDSYVYELAPT